MTYRIMLLVELTKPQELKKEDKNVKIKKFGPTRRLFN